MTPVTLKVNGLDVCRTVAPRMHLADFVREELRLTGTHIGCEHGVCGACTLMLDGRPVRSCLTYAVACAGSDVRTIESFDGDPVMTLLRDAFSRHHGLQCGYCTPGMLATAYDIVTRLPEADEARVREELAGNLCRCTGYVGIVAAIRDVLAGGPRQPAILTQSPSAPTPIAAIGPPAAAAASETAAVACADLAFDIEGGVRLVRSVTVEMEHSRLWALLEDTGTVASCLPGATLESVTPEGAVAGAFEIAVGPVRARFRGTGQVIYDREALRGQIRGVGGDGASRSRAEGQIRFAVRPQREAGAALDLAIDYKLGGPLAQFGRPAVVAAVADQLLADFSANLVAAAKGGRPAQPATLHGMRLLRGVLSALLHRVLSRG